MQFVHHRIHNHGLGLRKLKTPADVVGWMGAVQAQEYAMAKWGIAQRLDPTVTDDIVERAFAEGSILRTHVLRPTWHFVLPADIRWMLELTAPRIHALNRSMYRALELDDAALQLIRKNLQKALKNGKQLTRAELREVLLGAGIGTEGIRFAYILMHAELEGLICSGARKGKQFTYAWLEDRAPESQSWKRDEALAELVRRYFTSRGPATLQDFVWWSGLNMTDARRGIEMCKSDFVNEIIENRSYWFSPADTTANPGSPVAGLLPIYDEYPLAYKDRNGAIDLARHKKGKSSIGVPFNHPLLMNGKIIGYWKRFLKTSSVSIQLFPYTPLSKSELRAVALAANRYSAFLELPVRIA